MCSPRSGRSSRRRRRCRCARQLPDPAHSPGRHPPFSCALATPRGRWAASMARAVRNDRDHRRTGERMRIGIIGSGNIGSTTARLFVDAGHEVAIANSRGPQTLTGLVDSLGGRARAATAAQAAEFGEVVVVAIPFGRYRNLPAEELEGKIVADATNY